MSSPDSGKELSPQAVAQIARRACERYGAEYVGGRYSEEHDVYGFKAIWGDSEVVGSGPTAESAAEAFLFQLAMLDQLTAWREQIVDLTSEDLVRDVEGWLRGQGGGW
ncbi:hypothetical protein Srot_0791 [Segniliparus rotundus DSM 44985]|uniref:Uncharacterized protein n=1 Tax=Segniliparus rotundus (strain ATCC BAA-972 / CDC 1076 / CIP 108378 / DSM 44985 / JCM 13578) TaxID=640132 RepID=D6ZDZ0_SEGRD|nr:hypothetical protein [Segniliparus rotundus]ADG97270.1 hypothetical protein Srot_0791 [Segniliparus rotundus DSM 44985]